jgi:hypothetical protein
MDVWRYVRIETETLRLCPRPSADVDAEQRQDPVRHHVLAIHARPRLATVMQICAVAM